MFWVRSSIWSGVRVEICHVVREKATRISRLVEESLGSLSELHPNLRCSLFASFFPKDPRVARWTLPNHECCAVRRVAALSIDPRLRAEHEKNNSYAPAATHIAKDDRLQLQKRKTRALA